MPEIPLTGIVAIVLAGLIMGTSPWPLKLMRHFRYEHFGFISMSLALLVLPWAITLVCCPEPFAAVGRSKGTSCCERTWFGAFWGLRRCWRCSASCASASA